MLLAALKVPCYLLEWPQQRALLVGLQIVAMLEL